MTHNSNPWRNRLLLGNSIALMRKLPEHSVDLIITDPPYLVNYTSRDGRSFQGDNPGDADWLEPAFAEMYRVLKPNAFCLSFYGYPKADSFLSAFRGAGLSVEGHIVWHKSYASGQRYTRRTHESAYLLTKGRPSRPPQPVHDVLPWGKATGNRLHPCQKPVSVFAPIIEVYSKPGDLILDPFAGSASTAVAARELGRDYLAMELSWEYFQSAHKRLHS